MWIEIGVQHEQHPEAGGHATYVACGLKLQAAQKFMAFLASCHVCGMWIEMKWYAFSSAVPYRHATYVACGLKSCALRRYAYGEAVMPRMWHVD